MPGSDADPVGGGGSGIDREPASRQPPPVVGSGPGLLLDQASAGQVWPSSYAANRSSQIRLACSRPNSRTSRSNSAARSTDGSSGSSSAGSEYMDPEYREVHGPAMDRGPDFNLRLFPIRLVRN